MKYPKYGITLAAVAVAFAACGGGPVEPADIVGTYTATRFTLSGAETGDVLAEGGSIQLVLGASGTTSGTMVIPAMFTEDNMLATLDLTGTFALSDGVVNFDHAADTFIRDTPWQADGSTLRSNATFSGTTLDVVLTRQ